MIITYEDPRLVHETGLVDKTDPKYREAHPGGLRALSPKGGRIEIDYVISPVTGKPDNPEALLRKLIIAHLSGLQVSLLEKCWSGLLKAPTESSPGYFCTPQLRIGSY